MKPPVGPNSPDDPTTILYADSFGMNANNTAAQNATALTSAIAAIPTAGGKLRFGRGAYLLSSFPDLTDRRALIFEGEGGLTGGATEATQLIYTGTGTGTFITAQSTFGVQFRDMMIGHNAAFTGVLVDFSAKTAGLDTQFPGLSGVTLCGTSSTRGATGLQLVKALNGLFDQVNFRDLTIGVLGRTISGDYSNVHEFNKCRWGSIVTTPVKNIGDGWVLACPTFQQLVSGNAGGLAADSGVTSNGLVIQGGGFYDSTSATGTWVQYRGDNLTIDGPQFSACAIGIDLPDASQRAARISAKFSGSAASITVAINLGSSHQNHWIAGNYFHDTAVVTDIAMGAIPYYSFIMGRTGLKAPIDFSELASAPPAPASNNSRLYTDDSGGGKTRLRIRTDSADNNIVTSA